MKRIWGFLILLLIPWGRAAASETHTVLVFPFENQSARPDLNWMAEGFAELLSSRLSVPSCYALGRSEREQAYAQLGFPAGTPLTLASEYKVAETLGVDWAVVGSFRVDGGRLTARARLLDVRELKLSSLLESNGELADFTDLTTQLAWRLLATHDAHFVTGKEEDFHRQFPDIRLDAFENYIRGELTTDAKAREHFLREADRLNPADHRAAFALGRLYFEGKDYANSAQWLGKLASSDRNYLESLFLLAVDEFFLGKIPGAEKVLETLSREIPLSEVSSNLGVMKARQGRYKEALASFERAYQGDSTDPDFSFNMGACLWYLGRYDEAVKYLDQAARHSNDDAEVHTFLAVAFRKLGNADSERRELAWLADHEASPERIEEVAGDFVPQLRLKKNYDGRAFRLLALTVSHALEERLANEPATRHSEEHVTRGKTLLAEGRLPEAERELAEAVSLLPRDSETHLALAQVYEAEGQPQKAVTELETSLQLKASPTAHLRLARIYLALGQPEVARDHGRAALTLDPGNMEAARLIEAAKTNARAAASRKGR